MGYPLFLASGEEVDSDVLLSRVNLELRELSDENPELLYLPSFGLDANGCTESAKAIAIEVNRVFEKQREQEQLDSNPFWVLYEYLLSRLTSWAGVVVG